MESSLDLPLLSHFDIVQEDWIDAYDLVPDAEEDVEFDCTYDSTTKYGVGTALFLGMGRLVKWGIGWNLCTAALGDAAGTRPGSERGLRGQHVVKHGQETRRKEQPLCYTAF